MGLDEGEGNSEDLGVGVPKPGGSEDIDPIEGRVDVKPIGELEQTVKEMYLPKAEKEVWNEYCALEERYENHKKGVVVLGGSGGFGVLVSLISAGLTPSFLAKANTHPYALLIDVGITFFSAIASIIFWNYRGKQSVYAQQVKEGIIQLTSRGEFQSLVPRLQEFYPKWEPIK